MALRLKCTDTVGHRPAKLKLSLSCKTARYFINPSLPWWTVPHLHINGTQGIFEANTRWGHRWRNPFPIHQGHRTSWKASATRRKNNRFFDKNVLDHVLTVESACKRRLAENPAHPQGNRPFDLSRAPLKIIKNCSKSMLACVNSVSRIGPWEQK